MSDIRTVLINMDLGFDFVLSGMLLADDEGLDTAVYLSLFTDRRAGADDEIPGGSDDRRGFWLDGYADEPGDGMGSRLWLLERAKLTDETARRAREYCEEALAWLVRDGVAKRVTVETWIGRHHPLGVIGAQIEIYRADGPMTRYKFESLWRAV